MANIQNIREFWLCKEYVTALEYGDYSVFDYYNENSDDFSRWINDNNLNSCYFEYSDETDFTHCEYSGLLADCVLVSVFEDIG